MSQTRQERKKIAKKVARRKAYVTHRNKLHGRKLSVKKPVQAVEMDGAEFYRKLKEKENNDKKSQQKDSGKGFMGFIKNIFRGAQRGN